MITKIGLIQIVFYLLILLLMVKPLGWYMAQVYKGVSTPLNRVGGPLERFLYRLCSIKTNQTMDWKQYLYAATVEMSFQNGADSVRHAGSGTP